MDLYPFLNIFSTAAADDSALDDWANINFGSNVNVLVDLDSTNLPTVDDMPYALFQTPGMSKDQHQRINEYAFSVDLAFVKDALKIRSEANIKEPAGIELVSEFIALLVDAIETVVPDNFSFGYEVAADTLGSLPKVYAYLNFDFRETILIGENPIS